MTASTPNDQPVFDLRTLRLIIGALAIAFPAAVIALTGQVTTSISASYHELQTRDVFVGFLFIIGALLICYKGHVQGEPRGETESLWTWITSFKWINHYQEDLMSTLGGVAAILTALSPTACNGCTMDTRAALHMFGAFVLFANVAYFCMIAFLRSLNVKLLGYETFKENPEFMQRVNGIRSAAAVRSLNPFRKTWRFIALEAQIFLAIAREQARKYDRDGAAVRTAKLFEVYGKKITRGYVYLVCGTLIAVVLACFVVLMIFMPGFIEGTIATFVVEAIALLLFGIAWMTASQLEYLRQIMDWWEARAKKATTASEMGTA